MLQLGPLAFASPWLLVALAALPLLWWLLRVTPPSPRLVRFPPIRLLLALNRHQETPARTPLWLILLRMVIALLIILAVAHPLLNPGARLLGSGPLIVVIDDGWAAAVDWPSRTRVLESLIEQADRQGRAVRLLTTARAGSDKTPMLSDPMPAADALRVARAIKPKPWDVDRDAALAELDKAEVEGSAHVAWLSDGLDSDDARAFAERLQHLGSLEVYTTPAEATAQLVRPPKIEGDRLTVPVWRAGGQRSGQQWLRATAEDGRVLARQLVEFAPGQTETEVVLELPGELRNAVTALRLEGQTTAGGVFLLDERWRRRPVGLVSGDAAEASQPLLSSLFYLERGLKPFAEVRQGTVEGLLSRELAVLVLADIGKLTDSQTGLVTQWMERGGVVLRFAGPKLAQIPDELIPVRLRGGGRQMGGAMSWSKPATLKPFDEDSPFAGLPVPDDVQVNRQVLAEPSLDLDEKTWARLEDGTPLITADRRGKGWLILVHTTANTDWSNFALSGLYVNVLRRIVALSQGVVANEAASVFKPLQTLDGFGLLGEPPASASPISGREIRDGNAGPGSPPGYYGREDARRALNLSTAHAPLAPLKAFPPGVQRASYVGQTALDLKRWLLLAALVLALADLVISYALRGLMPLGARPRTAVRAGTTAAVVLVTLIASAPFALAQSPDEGTRPQERVFSGPDQKALEATLETRLAYVVTGDTELDAVSRAGLVGLSRVLRRRTAVEPAEPIGVQVERDELAFFPLLYWSVSPSQRPLSDNAIEKLNMYLRTGGTILFDTRERGEALSGSLSGGEASRRLKFLLNRLDIPALIHVPRDHVLTKSFYLLDEFPGRWAGGAVWVEQRGGRHNDGVSSVVIGSNDWAGAWAVDEFGMPMLPVVPGGDTQREMAYRFGVNWVMYAFTGNYKTDQVHVPAIIERLGQ